jgi:transposase
MKVVIGIDPHKASHTAVAIDEGEDELSSVKVRATRRQVEQLLSWAEPFEKRTWAIESVGGLGYLLAQQLVAQGEEVLDVPATLASRIRVLATKRSNKNDPNDAHSIAIAAMRSPTLRSVEPANHAEVLRLLAKRNMDIGYHRTGVICRLHALFAELAPGGIAKEMYVSDAERLMAKVTPENPAQQLRYDLALELLDDVRRLDVQLKESHRRIRVAVKASGTSVTDIYGVGPIIAAELIGYSGDICRFANRDAYVLQRDGPGRVLLRRPSRAPALASREPQAQPRPAHGRHLPDPPDGLRSRAYFERKVAEGKTKMEAIRALKRHISNAVYRQLLLDAR